MPKLTKFAELHSREDCRVSLMLIGFIYSPLVLMTGAAAVLGLS